MFLKAWNKKETTVFVCVCVPSSRVKRWDGGDRVSKSGLLKGKGIICSSRGMEATFSLYFHDKCD